MERWRRAQHTCTQLQLTELPRIRVQNRLALNRPLYDTLWSLANRAVHRDLWRKWFITHARIVRSVSPRCPTRTAIPVSAFRRPTESRMAPKLKPGHAKRRSTSPITATYSYDDPAPPNSAISPQACSFDTSACAAVTGATPLADSPAAAPVVRPPSAAAALKDPAVPRPAGTQSPCRAD